MKKVSGLFVAVQNKPDAIFVFRGQHPIQASVENPIKMPLPRKFATVVAAPFN